MTADTPSPSEVVEAEGTPNPWPEDSDYGKFWRRGYDAGKGDALRRLTPAIINAANRASSPRPSTVGEATVEAVKRLTEALTPSADTKAAYMGEFSFQIELAHPRLGSEWRSIDVPWTTIKEIMAAIRARAAIASLPSVAVQPIGEQG